ncbi:terminase family protein [Micromonospora sp. NPDC049645]|uniref:terminase large subunit domain-containing protein n=1 Tax=Micromonospora sp. NPDC049645 TaxID=3155508 RepID=UPI00341B9AF1
MSAVSLRPPGQMTDAELIAEIEALRRANDVEALATPTTLARHLSPSYVRRRHVNVIGREIAALEAGEFDRLLISTPPQVGKTVTAVVWAAFWWLCKHPGHRVIIGSYGTVLATKRGVAVRKLVELYGERYGLVLEPGDRSKSDWSLTTGGGLKSVGIAAGITGNPGDVVFVDDPHKSRADAESIKRRDAVDDWLMADIESRMAPDAPIVIIMTRWHADDIAGRVVEREGRTTAGGRWRVVVMPALCTDQANDPLGRQLGDPLPHPKIKPGDREALLRHWEGRRRSNRLRDWSSLYQCDPQPAAGALLTEAQLRGQRWYKLPRKVTATPVIKAVAVDPSGGGRDVAGIVAGWLGDDDRLYLTHDRSDVLSAADWGKRACELAVDTDADRFVVEINYGGDQASYVLKAAWHELRRAELTALGLPDTPAARRSAAYRKSNPRFARPRPRIVTVHARRGKLLRAEPIAVQWTTDRIRTAAELLDLEKEWATWQPTDKESPGRIDASVHLAWSVLRPPTGSESGIQSPAAVSRSQVAGRSSPAPVREQTPGRVATTPRINRRPRPQPGRGYPG